MINNLESTMKQFLTTLASEFVGGNSAKRTTSNEDNLFDSKGILYNAETGFFEVDSLQLLSFANLIADDQRPSLRNIHEAIRAIMGSGWGKSNFIYTTRRLTNDKLQTLFNGKETIKVYRYTFDAQKLLNI